MMLRDISEQLDVHESIISRATINKYIATPQGVFELKFFFSNAINNTAGAQVLSTEAVRARLRQLIKEEDKAKCAEDASRGRTSL